MSRRRAAAAKATPVAAKAPLTLVVDDFADNREMYSQFLSFSGYRVAEAQNGHEALEKAFQLAPDLIVMDLSLPGLDGWEATRRLKADDRSRAIPIIALTGHALAGHSKGALDAGCDAFITKPCLPERLLDEIRAIHGTARARSGEPTPGAAASSAPAGPTQPQPTPSAGGRRRPRWPRAAIGR